MKRGARPGHGTGTDGGDLFQPKGDPVAESVPDERRERLFCKKCGKEVQHVQVGDRWVVRDPDNIPHVLTCSG